MYIEWLELYPVVTDLLGIDPARDSVASYVLRNLLLQSRMTLRLEHIGRVAVVVGAGPSLSSSLPRLADCLSTRVPIVAADGATRAVVELGLAPKAIASDLDGDVDAILEACRRGSTLFLHAHGDNIERVLELYPELSRACREIVGTTQVPNPPYPLINLGGFTDGDRACLAAYLLGARRIVLLGMDLSSSYIGKYSKGLEMRVTYRKAVKLWVARRILERLGRRAELVEVGAKCLTSSRGVSVEKARTMVLNWLR